MNAKQLIAVVAVFAAAGSAIADSTGNFTDFVNVSSDKTRAEVTHEMHQARPADNYATVGGQEVTNPASQVAGTNNARAPAPFPDLRPKTRADVIAELKQAQAEGSYMVGGEEYVEPTTLARSSRGRNEERSKVLAVERNKQLPASESGN